MTALLRSELLKVRTTRTTTSLVASMGALAILIVALHVVSFRPSTLARVDSQREVVGLGTTVAALFASLTGALAMTAEFRTGTIRPTLLITPQRLRVFAAKAAVGLGAGALVGVGALVLTAGTEAVGLHLRGVDVRLQAADYGQLIIGGASAAALFGVIGVGLAAAVRSQVAALVALCVWLLFLEPLVLGNAPDVGRYAPEASAGALAGAIQTASASNLLPPAAAALLLLTYTALAATAGALSLTRRDID